MSLKSSLNNSGSAEVGPQEGGPMPSPLYRIIYENHELPLENFIFSRAEIIRAQVAQPPDLGRIIVVERVVADGDETDYAISVLGQWEALPDFTRPNLNRLLRKLERETTDEEE